MQIEVNGKRLDVAAQTLAALLRELEYDERHVATALNQMFVRRMDRAETKLALGDRIEIVSPRQGG
jgi:sulfur carrier protein